jgi:hypothetical protein
LSPEKPRFFGSSGSGLEVLLAIDRSRKSHEEEERRRLALYEAQRDREKTSIGGPELAPSNQSSNPQHDARGSTQCPTLREGWPQGGPPQAVDSDIESATNQDKTVTGGQPEAITTMASQETDYGDIELDSMDFDELNRVLED